MSSKRKSIYKTPKHTPLRDQERVPRMDYYRISMMNYDFDNKFRKLQTQYKNANKKLKNLKPSKEKEIKELKTQIKNLEDEADKIEHDRVFLATYPSMAIKHVKGEPWGTTGNRSSFKKKKTQKKKRSLFKKKRTKKKGGYGGKSPKRTKKGTKKRRKRRKKRKFPRKRSLKN
tara:strand:+ start:11 stop:529 length:519 start_codon:yes stop_codon:yes gene_type:complete